MQDAYQGLYRSSDDQMLAGVCGGLAHKLRLNTFGVRVLFLVLVFSSVGLPVYLVLWLLLKPLPTRGVV